MKAKSIATAVLVSIFINIYSQDPEWEETPWGAAVLTWIYDEASDQDRADGDADTRIDYPNVIFLYHGDQYSSSDKFNCHGYVWYMSDAADGPGISDKRRVDESNGTIPYISDNYSYKVVSTEAEADMVWWNDGSHSALTTETPGTWRSKWNVGPLVEHDWEDQPYGTTGLVYYKRCGYTITNMYNTDDLLHYCALHLVNSGISSNVDLEIEYEKRILIEGPFNTGTGATLYIHPE